MGFASLFPILRTKIACADAERAMLTENGMPGIERQDIIVLICLAVVFCWTYVVLPLVFFPR